MGMHLPKIMMAIFWIVILGIVACSEIPEKNIIYLSGKVGLTHADHEDWRAFVTIVKSNSIKNINGLRGLSSDSIVDLFEVDRDNNTFNVELSEKGLTAGDSITIFAFVDKDYSLGIPFPNQGDIMGFYYEQNAGMFSTSYVLKNGVNDMIEIQINREIFSFEADVVGTVGGSDAGDLTLIAYAGEITSSDFNKLDFDSIIGYQTQPKRDTGISFQIDVLPYGFNIFKEDVYAYFLAVLDINQNQKIDAGDKIGYYSDGDDMPLHTKIDKTTTFLDSEIQLTMDIEAPSGVDMTLSGSIPIPPTYTISSKPLYILITDANDVDAMLSDPASAVKYFEKISPGETVFNIDLSDTGLVPGDQVMVFVLWDRDYEYGFPKPTAYDYIGFYQNRNEILTSVRLTQGQNLLLPANGWDLTVNKIWYEHAASVEFILDDGGLPLRFDDNGDWNKLDPGDHIILIAIHKNGVNDEWSGLTPPNFSISDMDYILGMNTHVVTADPNERYALDIYPMINSDIAIQVDPFLIKNVYVFAVLDENVNGLLDEGEYIGYYWRQELLFFFPKMIEIPEDYAYEGESIRFANQKF